MPNLEQVWNLAAPFIAAGLASWLTYTFAIRQRRTEILIEQQVAAFKELQGALVGLIHYCEFSRFANSDIGPSLPEDTPKSALLNAQRMSHCLDANRIYLSNATRMKVAELSRIVSAAASMELAAMSDPSVVDTTLYKRIRADADSCIERLHEELVGLKAK